MADITTLLLSDIATILFPQTKPRAKENRGMRDLMVMTMRVDKNILFGNTMTRYLQ